MRRQVALLVGASLHLLGCTSFPTIEAGVCGNRVLEKPEACDTFVEARTELCRPPGDPLECQYDCRVDDEGNRPTCPKNSGCAADGVCRSVTGKFEPPLALSTEPTAWLSTADFDGDGRVDLLSADPVDQWLQSRFRVHYFNAGEQEVTTRSFPRDTTRPVVRDVNGDHNSDLLFSNFRIGMVPGRHDRDWLPATFSSYQVPTAGLRVFSVLDDLVGGATALVALTELDGVSGLFSPDYRSGKLQPRAELPRRVAELAGLPLAADIVVGPTSPCSEIVVAFEGDDAFRVYDLCSLNSDPALPEVLWRDAPLEQTVRLPAGLSVDAAVVAADVNGDGQLDVVVGASGRPYVAYGDGVRLADDAVALEIAITDEDGTQLAPLPTPLAAGDLSGDGLADFILPYGIVSSRPRLSDDDHRYSVSYENRGAAWTMAEVADINGNGVLDVIAATAGLPGLDFVNGTGGRYQVAAALPTGGPVQFLTTGDFDGDLINDVAMVEGDRTREAAGFLSLAFGLRDSPPLRGQRVAELGDVEQLGSLGELGLDNLLVASREKLPGDPSTTLTLFDGSPDRLPFAPYSLVTFSFDGQLQDSLGLAVVVGSFSGSGSNDLLALGTVAPSQGWTQWLAPDIASGRYPPQLLKGDQPPGVVPVQGKGPTSVLSVAGAAADLDGDGRDEALWLMPEGGAGCALLVYEIAVEAALLKAELHFEEPCRTPALVAFDQDRSGYVDLMLLLGEPQRLHVLWNDGEGGFSLERRTIVSDPERGEIRGFCPFPQEPGDDYRYRYHLAFVSADTLYVGKPKLLEDEASSEQAQTFDDIATISRRLEDARAVVVLDPNGDLVPGLAVADAQGIRLFEAALR